MHEPRNGPKEWAQANVDLAQLRRDSAEKLCRVAELARTDADLLRASVDSATSRLQELERMGEAYQARTREAELLRDVSKLSDRALTAMRRAYELLEGLSR